MSEEAKNKAIEIIEQHAFLLTESISLSNTNSQEYKACVFDLAKQCALISVDEIISYHNSLFDSGLKDVHIALSSPIKPYVDVLNPKLKFWQEVKNQIKSI